MSDYRAIRHGINYASSSAGILAETATNIFVRNFIIIIIIVFLNFHKTAFSFFVLLL